MGKKQRGGGANGEALDTAALLGNNTKRKKVNGKGRNGKKRGTARRTAQRTSGTEARDDPQPAPAVVLA